MTLEQKQARLGVLFLQREAIQSEINVLKVEVVQEMNRPTLPTGRQELPAMPTEKVELSAKEDKDAKAN